MGKTFILALAMAAALSACTPQRGRSGDITSSDEVCVDSSSGMYCRGSQGNLIKGREVRNFDD